MVKSRVTIRPLSGNMTDMRWPLTFRQRLVPNECRVKWGLDGKDEVVVCKIRDKSRFYIQPKHCDEKGKRRAHV